MTRSRMLSIGAVVAIIGLSLFIFSPRQSSFRLASATPSDKGGGFDPDKSLEFKFSSALDLQNPYESFMISPKTPGKVVAANDTLRFTADNGFRESITYSLSIKNVYSADGKTTSVDNFSFTTKQRRVSDFESKLPYDGGDFIIERLSDRTITITILNPPADIYKQKALSLLASKGIDSKNVKVQLAASAY